MKRVENHPRRSIGSNHELCGMLLRLKRMLQCDEVIP